MNENIDYKQILLQLLASLMLCDHMGDVGNDMAEVCDRIGLPTDINGEFVPLKKLLHEMGVTTLYGTSLE